MRFDCGPTYLEKCKAKKQWHRFFCIFPRRVGPRDCRWLETIERRGTFHFGYLDDYWEWEYRAIKPE